mmetsp:Transcript_12633/g.28893  ORF Transcript_12633/g.28893 Transcript_12633/m.28893 type:complete len:189 (-) Transcript_12633:234-800(-)
MADGDKLSKLFSIMVGVLSAAGLMLAAVVALDIPAFVKGAFIFLFVMSSWLLVPKCSKFWKRMLPSPKPAETCSSFECVMATCSYSSLASSALNFHVCSIGKDEVTCSTGTEVRSVPPTKVCPSQTTCICCLEDFEEDSKVAVTMCGHVFHEDCLASWLLARPGARSCPTCRAALLPSVMSAGVEFTV